MIHLLSIHDYFRYHLYVDCMPTDGLTEINKDMLDRMIRIARSSQRLMKPRYIYYASLWYCYTYMYSETPLLRTA